MDGRVAYYAGRKGKTAIRTGLELRIGRLAMLQLLRDGQRHRRAGNAWGPTGSVGRDGEIDLCTPQVRGECR